jgi:hypothetical protein
MSNILLMSKGGVKILNFQHFLKIMLFIKELMEFFLFLKTSFLLLHTNAVLKMTDVCDC